MMKVSSQTLDKLSEAYTDALIAKFNDKLFWEKPWFNIQNVPVNLRGTGYSGANLFLLSLMMSAKNYQLPVFLTYNQAQKIGINVSRGEKGYPVQRYITYYVDENRKYLSEEDFRKLTSQEQGSCTKRVKLSSYTVFNIEQTSIKQDQPAIYNKLQDRYSGVSKGYIHGEGNAMLDQCISQQKWICPIYERVSNQAYYSPREHHIVIPQREQFKQMPQFYSTALHEMAHSTKHPESIGRNSKVAEGVDPYGHEELIAELSAGLTGLVMGIEQTPQQNNIAYLKCWLDNIKQEPHYIFNCLSDAKNISRYMCERVGVDLTQTIKQEKDELSVPADIQLKQLNGMKL